MPKLLNVKDEKWERIPDYEEFYEISNLGRVKSRGRYARSGSGLRRVPQKLLTQTIHPQTGHCRVQLSKRGKTKTCVVYRLVLEIYGKMEKLEGHDVRHIDGNRENNAIENLKWVSLRAAKSGEAHGRATLSDGDIEEIRLLREGGVSVDQIADKMQISKSQVSKVTSGKSRQNI